MPMSKQEIKVTHHTGNVHPWLYQSQSTIEAVPWRRSEGCGSHLQLVSALMNARESCTHQTDLDGVIQRYGPRTDTIHHVLLTEDQCQLIVVQLYHLVQNDRQLVSD